MTQLPLRGGHWEFEYIPVSIWTTQVGLGGLCFSFLEGRAQGYRLWTLEDWEASVIGVQCGKFPNNKNVILERTNKQMFFQYRSHSQMLLLTSIFQLDKAQFSSSVTLHHFKHLIPECG